MRITRLRRRFRRAVGEYFFSVGTAELAELSETAGDAFSFAILFSWEELLHARLTSTQGTNQRDFCEIIVVQTRNVLLMRAGNCLLRLYDLYCVGNAGGEAIAVLGKCLVSQINIATRNFHLFRR